MVNGQTSTDAVRIRIKGGADSYHAAAIAAVVEHALAQERRGDAPALRRFSNWMMVTRKEPFMAPRATSGVVVSGGGQPPAPRRIRPEAS